MHLVANTKRGEGGVRGYVRAEVVCRCLELPMLSFHRLSTFKNLLKSNTPNVVATLLLMYATASCVSIMDPGNTTKKKSIAYLNADSVNFGVEQFAYWQS